MTRTDSNNSCHSTNPKRDPTRERLARARRALDKVAQRRVGAEAHRTVGTLAEHDGHQTTVDAAQALITHDRHRAADQAGRVLGRCTLRIVDQLGSGVSVERRT